MPGDRPDCTSLLTPPRPALRFDAWELTPGLGERIVYAAAETGSLLRGKLVLEKIGGGVISTNTIERVVGDVGAELPARRDADPKTAEALAQRPESPPELAVVECDGGRIRARELGLGPGVHLSGEGWRETKNACLIRGTRQTFDDDPQPEPPACFCDPPHVAQIAESEALSVASPPAASEGGQAEQSGETQVPFEGDWRPKRFARQKVRSYFGFSSSSSPSSSVGGRGGG